jgi:hypothetical protein
MTSGLRRAWCQHGTAAPHARQRGRRLVAAVEMYGILRRVLCGRLFMVVVFKKCPRRGSDEPARAKEEAAHLQGAATCVPKARESIPDLPAWT